MPASVDVSSWFSGPARERGGVPKGEAADYSRVIWLITVASFCSWEGPAASY